MKVKVKKEEQMIADLNGKDAVFKIRIKISKDFWNEEVKSSKNLVKVP